MYLGLEAHESQNRLIIVLFGLAGAKNSHKILAYRPIIVQKMASVAPFTTVISSAALKLSAVIFLHNGEEPHRGAYVLMIVCTDLCTNPDENAYDELNNLDH